MPGNRPFVFGGMANHRIEASDRIRQLGVTRQAASQLIDTLVVRGYLERAVNPHDRRRMTNTLADRGRGAAAAVRDGVLAGDAELATMLTPDELIGLCAGLAALCGIRERVE